MRYRQVHIGVVGPSQATAEQLRAAEAVGRRLAEVGWYLVCGGMGGVMEAACRGAQSLGGMTIGLLPGLSRDDGNDHLTVAVPTGMGELRNGLLVRSSDALVAIGGSWGTLSEISLALRTGVPVIGLGTWTVDTGGAAVPSVEPVRGADDVVPTLRARLHRTPPR